MLARIHGFISAHNLARTGDRILLAVSGGIDSMVMASLFLHLPFEAGIAHCNFSLRGDESDLDEDLVREFAANNGLHFFSARFDTKKHASDNGISTQMAARELRYTWFEQVRESNGYNAVAIAHNLNDNAETVIINLSRGTGPAGLSGMKVKSGRIIRPLLFATREEISAYAAEHSIGFREDKSNAEIKYTRNRVRHNLLPILQEINPSILNTLTETAERFSELNEIVGAYIAGLKKDMARDEDGNHLFDIVKLKTFSGNRTILFELFRPYGLNNSRLTDLQHIIEGRSGSFIETETHRILRNRNELIVTKKEIADDSPLLIENPGDFVNVKRFNSDIRTVDGNFIIPRTPLVAALDLDKIMFPVIIRKWHAGDWFYPLGMNDRKKLSDYFIDRKYSILEKGKKLILESAGKIVCIVGDRIDNRFKITPETRRVLIIKPL